MDRDYRQASSSSYRSGEMRRSHGRWQSEFEGGERGGGYGDEPYQSTSAYDTRERDYDRYGTQHEYGYRSGAWHRHASEQEEESYHVDHHHEGRRRHQHWDNYSRDDGYRPHEDNDDYRRRDHERQSWHPHPDDTSNDLQEGEGRSHQQYNDHESKSRPTPAMQLRLVKLVSDVLPAAQEVAVIDGRGDGVSIGRDRCFTARIRCPSMEVSKHHANIFRMSTDQRGHDVIFAITDTGSTHGTYLLLNPPTDLTKESLPPTSAYKRLSEPKKASTPKGLRHMSLLRVGRTVFQVHLHTGWSSSCSECALKEDGSNEISLLASDATDPQNAKTAKKKTFTSASNSAAKNTIISTLAPKAALKALKNQHLGEEPDEPANEPAQYVDRAAARRARGGIVVQADTSQKPSFSSAATATASSARISHPAPSSSEPAAKLNASNVGFKMFESMAMKGGDSKLASHDPIMARGVEGRAGLGSKRLLDVHEMASQPSGYSAESVRERQRRRFEEAR